MTIILNALVFVVTCNFACNALQILPFRRNANRPASITSSPNQPMLTIRRVTPEIDVSDDKEGKTTLTLAGEMSAASNELPKTSIEDVSEFFRTQAYRNLLVTGGGERPYTEVEITSGQLSDWKSRCLALGAYQPDENDSILSVLTRGIRFPGLNVATSSLIGVKYIEMETISPRYEFVLLANEQTVSGLAPAVWIFRKLTGADESGSEDNSKFKSLTTITYEEKNNGNVVFRTDGFLSIDITFPKFLLKILPGDKKTIEERGGKSIVKTLDKDVVQSMKAFEKAYSEKFNF